MSHHRDYVEGHLGDPVFRDEYTYQLLIHALCMQRCVSAVYQGHVRLFCPHTIGSKHGTRRVLAYQYGGASSKELGPPGSGANWRCFIVSGLSEVKLIEGTWQTGPNHSVPQTCINDVVKEHHQRGDDDAQ